LLRGHIGGSGFRFGLSTKQVRCPRLRSYVPKSYPAIFTASRSTRVSGRQHSFPSTALGTSCLPWSYVHRVSCQISNLIVACGMESVNKVEKESRSWKKSQAKGRVGSQSSEGWLWESKGVTEKHGEKKTKGDPRPREAGGRKVQKPRRVAHRLILE